MVDWLSYKRTADTRGSKDDFIFAVASIIGLFELKPDYLRTRFFYKQTLSFDTNYDDKNIINKYIMRRLFQKQWNYVTSDIEEPDNPNFLGMLKRQKSARFVLKPIQKNPVVTTIFCK